jgi:hypothetical protein
MEKGLCAFGTPVYCQLNCHFRKSLAGGSPWLLIDNRA